MTLSRFNLNYLYYFSELIANGSVSKAAQKVGISQPAMSRVLAELRSMYQDPLLCRVHNKTTPTPKALALYKEVQKALNLIQNTLEKERRFDPNHDEWEVTIRSNDFIEFLMLPKIQQTLEKNSYGIKMNFLPWGYDPVAFAKPREEVDLTIGLFEAIPENVCYEFLFETHWVTLTQKNHPGIDGPLTLETFTQLNHMIIPDKCGTLLLVDPALKALGLKRNVVLSIPHFMMVPFVIAKTKIIITTTEKTARYFQQFLPLDIHHCPLQIPNAKVLMTWHPRFDQDPRHLWLRSQIKEIVQSL